MFDINMDKVYVKTFGGFDLYYRGELIYFSSSKAKELLAVLVDWRGKAVTLAHLAGVLSEGERDEAAAKQAVHLAWHIAPWRKRSLLHLSNLRAEAKSLA